MDQATQQLMDSLCEQGLKPNLALYLDFLESKAEDSWIPASAIRLLARSGELAEEAIDPICQALALAEEDDAFMHLAKAVAAFGRKGAPAEGVLIERLSGWTVTNDEQFWAFDSALHALGYVGSEAALVFVEQLKAESPPRVLLSKSIYKGEYDDSAREKWFRESLEAVEERIRAEDPGCWRKKMTEIVYEGADEAAPSKMSPWMTR